MTISATLVALLAAVPVGTPQPYIAAVEKYTERDIPHITFVRHRPYTNLNCFDGSIAFVAWEGPGVVAPRGWRIHLCPRFRWLSRGEKLWVLAHESEHLFGRDHEPCGLMFWRMEEVPC